MRVVFIRNIEVASIGVVAFVDVQIYKIALFQFVLFVNNLH